MLPWYLDTFILKDLTESWHSRVNEVRPSFTILKHSCLSARIILHVGYVLWNFSSLSCTFLLSPHGGGATRCQCLSNQKAPSCETLVTRGGSIMVCTHGSLQWRYACQQKLHFVHFIVLRAHLMDLLTHLDISRDFWDCVVDIVCIYSCACVFKTLF